MPEICCYSVNISEQGMAMSTSVSFTAGDDVRVQFTLPDHKVPFLAESTICWSKTGHLGVRFVSLSRKHQHELQNWAIRKAGRNASGIRRREIPEGGRRLHTDPGIEDPRPARWPSLRYRQRQAHCVSRRSRCARRAVADGLIFPSLKVFRR